MYSSADSAKMLFDAFRVGCIIRVIQDYRFILISNVDDVRQNNRREAAHICTSVNYHYYARAKE